MLGISYTNVEKCQWKVAEVVDARMFSGEFVSCCTDSKEILALDALSG